MNTKMGLALVLVSILLIPFGLSIQTLKADSNVPIAMHGGVALYSPVNTTYFTNSLVLNLTFGWGAGLQCSLKYNVDGKYDGSIPLAFNDTTTSGFQLIALARGSLQLPKLSDGSHHLTIYVEADLNNYHGANPPGAPFKETPPGSANYVASWLDTVDFTTASGIRTFDSTPPKITNISIENQTYNTTTIQLSFTVDKNLTQTAYSLDGKANITVAGNTTLTELTVGTHNVTVYAWNEEENGASQTINFAIAERTSATVQPLKPFPITTIITTFSAFTVGCVLTFLFFFRKNKR